MLVQEPGRVEEEQHASWHSGFGVDGGKLGTLFARAGHEVVFSYARSEQKLKRLAQNANGNARPGTPCDAAQEADAYYWPCTGRELPMC